MSIADRSILACWGVKGGLAGQAVPGHRRPRRAPRARGRRAGRRRAGGGRRGDPDPHHRRRRLGRPARARPGARGPRRGVAQGSREAALAAYGVVLTGELDDARPRRGCDGGRARLRPAPSAAFFDRGPGYARLAGGRRARRRGRGRLMALVGSPWWAATARPVSPSATRCVPRGASRCPSGGREWADLVGALEGCEAAYLIAPNFHPDEPGLIAQALDAIDRRGSRPGGLPLGRLAVRPRDAAPPRQGGLRGPGPAVGAGLDDPAAGRLPAEPRPERPGRGALRRRRRVRLRGPGRGRRGGCAGAHRARARRCDVRAGLAGGLGGRAGCRGRCPAVAGRPAPDGWLGAMYAYYDAHGLPVGVLPLRTLLAEGGAA